MTWNDVYDRLSPEMRWEAMGILAELKGHRHLDAGDFAMRFRRFLWSGGQWPEIVCERMSHDQLQTLADFYQKQSHRRAAEGSKEWERFYLDIASALLSQAIDAQQESFELANLVRQSA